MKHHPERIHSLVLTNIEAYDQWPSKPETPYLRMILNPVTGPFFRLAFGLEPLQREAYSVAVRRGKNLRPSSKRGASQGIANHAELLLREVLPVEIEVHRIRARQKRAATRVTDTAAEGYRLLAYSDVLPIIDAAEHARPERISWH